MTPLIVLGVTIGLPVILGIVFRVNSIYMYLSVVAGHLLLNFVGDDAALAASGFVKGQYSQMIASLFLLLVPLVITFVFLRSTIAKSKILLHFVAYIAVGASLYVFIVPLLTAGIVGAILASPIGKTINTAQDLIIASSALVVLSTMWLTSRQNSHGRYGKHH